MNDPLHVKTFRAGSLPEALALVRRELGGEAAVLRTREVAPGLIGWLRGSRLVEVTASTSIDLPSRLPRKAAAVGAGAASTSPPYQAAPPAMSARPALGAMSPPGARWSATIAAAPLANDPAGAQLRPTEEAAAASVQEFAPLAPPRTRDHGLDLDGDGPAFLARQVGAQLQDLRTMVTDLCRRSSGAELPEPMFRLYGELLDAEFGEAVAHELVDRVSKENPPEPSSIGALKARVAQLLAAEIAVRPPLELGDGKQRLVALVGPTGVGKTTTIAKLAAHYRLQRQCRVGLITVDTYRIAAVEQLGAYAGIMDLPMVVVSTPAEMRQAVSQLSAMDLVLLDTAGRSARDDQQIDELRAMLREASPDEVHLVLSGASSGANQRQTAERFAAAGATALVLTKLDEASGLGSLVPLLRACGLPLSYVTCGQNVPADISAADPVRLARRMVGLE